MVESLVKLHFWPVAAAVETSLASETVASVDLSAGFSQDTSSKVVAPASVNSVVFIVLLFG